jgi:PAS domain S-box-containing protein
MEEALRRAREELEIRVQERTTELAKANPVLQVEITERKKAEETLQQTRDYLESLINYANALIIVWDTNFKITRLNRAFEHLTGYSVNEVIGQELRILFPEATRDELMNKIALTLGGEYWESVEIPILCKDGNIRLVLWNSANIYTEDRKTLLATIAQGTDITERKKAEDALRASEAKYRLLTENLSQKIFLKDRNSVYLSCNENYARDLKIEAEEIKGKTDYDFYPKDLVEKYRADDKRIMDSGKAEEIEEKYIQDGREIVVHTVKTPIKDEQGNVIGILGIFWDITERKKAEEQQRLLMKDLEETNRIMTGRELRMIELKKEVNKLSEELGRPKPYEI